jgi:hypothetical protein
MKEIDELNDRMNGNDEIVDSIIKKMDELEKREVKNTDYSLHFEALKKIFEVFLNRYNKESAELKVAIGQLNINYPSEQIQGTLAEVKPIVEGIRKLLPIRVRHQFDFTTKGWIIAGMMLLIITAICTGLCGYLWTENSRMQANDIKFRMIRQVYPIQGNWADSYYSKNPEGMEDTTAKLEEQALERSSAQDRIEQAERKVKQARQQLKKNK